jgi:hypothetical protein
MMRAYGRPALVSPYQVLTGRTTVLSGWFRVSRTWSSAERVWRTVLGFSCTLTRDVFPTVPNDLPAHHSQSDGGGGLQPGHLLHCCQGLR